MTSRILLVEDDLTLADWVCEYLREQNFIVDHVARGDLVMALMKPLGHKNLFIRS